MGLQGNLEYLPLLDIVQIVSFSRKTGYLSIEMEGGQGAIVFSDGLVVCAFTGGSPPADSRLRNLPAPARDKVVSERIALALERLARLREGLFAFELTDEVPRVIGSREISLETLSEGIDPHQMLLDLSEGIDGDRARSTEALEASFASAEDAPVGDPVVPATVFEADMEAAEQELVETPPEPPAGYPGTQEGAVPRPPRPGSDTRPYMPVRPIPPSTADGPRSPAPSPPTRPAQPPPARTILLVDDEEDVRRILGRHFAAAGFRIEEAGNPDSALKAAGRLRGAKEPFVLVTDLGMPSSGGASFHGGFEVVKRLWKMNLRPPVLMMTESLGQSLRLRARQMGVRSFVFKPTLSKLNAQQFEADLSAFAGKIVAEVLPRLAEGQAPVAASRPGGKAKGGEEAGRAAQDAAQAFPFLRRRLVELRQGKDASHVAALVMKVAREFFERAVLFVIRNEKARGLGGFGLAPRDETLHLLAREITIPLDEPSVFRDVALERRLFQGPPPPDRWAGHLLGRIGRFHSGAVAILPLVAHRETIALLFGDNPETGRAPAGLESLDVFMRQAGTALENISLQRKLQAMEDKGEAGLG